MAKSIYQSARDGPWDLPKDKLPKNGIRVSEVSSFDNLTGHGGKHTSPVADPTLNEIHPLPGLTLKDGTILDQIDKIIFCTGYHSSYPFLPSPPIPPSSSSSVVRDSNNNDDTLHLLITDGTMTHNLHKDIFYIPDPTLSFIGVPFHCATFSLFEFQAIALAAVYAGRARLPTEDAMRAEYTERLRRKGTGRGFHSLLTEEVDYVRDLVGWVNTHNPGGEVVVEGHTVSWIEERERLGRTVRKRLGERV